MIGSADVTPLLGKPAAEHGPGTCARAGIRPWASRRDAWNPDTTGAIPLVRQEDEDLRQRQMIPTPKSAHGTSPSASMYASAAWCCSDFEHERDGETMIGARRRNASVDLAGVIRS